MFDKHLTTITTLIYGLICAGATLWLAWICFTSLSFVIALLVFSLSFVALAAAFGARCGWRIVGGGRAGGLPDVRTAKGYWAFRHLISNSAAFVHRK